MNYTILPTINAILNSASAMLLSAGYLFIRNKKIIAHKLCMLTAVLTSILFLTSYLVYHAHIGLVRFLETGWLRHLYLAILISHTFLAVVTVPLVLLTLLQAFRARFDKHRCIARWTLPIWFYVSVTGVIVYWMLYHLAQ